MDSEERTTNKTKRRHNKDSPHPFQNLKDEITLRKEERPFQQGRASYQQHQPNESYVNLKKELERLTPKQAHSFWTDFQLETTEKINFITNYIASRRKMKSEALRLLKLEQQQQQVLECDEGEANKM
ncbi:hypothetical protein Pcinc_030521 [Petrolisthes cinctipes]|uniref:Uncharacterized protein n=1 Tax=Petrolisthes cinctipes TaxID=88211 RepID=A0AAE1EYN7_PETCI|nr:hypothetical protein Pcinc_030521 [Petrolisthes cinctipes]